MTKLRQKILIHLLKCSPIMRTNLKRVLEANNNSLHNSLLKMQIEGLIRIESIKSKGNPQQIFLTSLGKSQAEVYLKMTQRSLI
jgi:DNA-binding HxlR family transcriptional regulator